MLTAASHRPPKCGACGGMNFQLQPSVVRILDPRHLGWTLKRVINLLELTGRLGHWF